MWKGVYVADEGMNDFFFKPFTAFLVLHHDSLWFQIVKWHGLLISEEHMFAQKFKDFGAWFVF